MNITFIVTRNGSLADTKKQPLESLGGTTPIAPIVYVNYGDDKTEEAAINEAVKEIGTTHVVIIPDGSYISENYMKVVDAYVNDLEAVYLPIGSYCHDDDSDEEVFKGFLNTIMWKAHIASTIGELDLPAALKQADTTLYFAIIPTEVLKNNLLSEEVKYFSQFEYLNRIIAGDVTVLGIPKMVFTLMKDYELKSVNKDEKIKYFAAARADYNSMPAELQSIVS